MVPVLVSTGFRVRNNQAGLSLTSLGLVFVISNINGVLDGDQRSFQKDGTTRQDWPLNGASVSCLCHNLRWLITDSATCSRGCD